jgi:hypothetical protein
MDRSKEDGQPGCIENPYWGATKKACDVNQYEALPMDNCGGPRASGSVCEGTKGGGSVQGACGDASDDCGGHGVGGTRSGACEGASDDARGIARGGANDGCGSQGAGDTRGGASGGARAGCEEGWPVGG